MASLTLLCDICASQQKSSPVEIRCLECEESLCVDCSKHHAVSKATRNHDTIPITEYTNLPNFILKIEKHCSEHNERFTLYCHEHACPACTSCSLEKHKHCSKVSKIEDVVGNAKSSSTLTEIEELLCDVLKHIDSLFVERTKNVVSLQKQKNEIENDISAIRFEIDKHLDKMQSEIINSLNENEKREREKIQLVLQSLSVKKSYLEEVQQNIVALKKHASDLQTFLAVREMEKRSTEIRKNINGMMEAGDFNNTTLTHKELISLSDLSSVDFGQIVTVVSPSNVKITLSKENQAQIPISILPPYAIESVSVKLNRSFNTGCQNTRGCVVLPDGMSLFTCYKKCTITGIDGNDMNVKSLYPSSVFDLAYSEDLNKIYISTGLTKKQEFIEMNLNDGNIKSLGTDSDNYGVVVKQNKLLYCAHDKGLCERNLSDGSVRIIVNERLPRYCYVTEYRDQLYYTNNEDDSVTCCRKDGRQIWKFSNYTLKRPYGISVDNYGNVYVVSKTPAVVMISADGIRHREIVSKMDGLDGPRVLYYQRSTNKLLVACKEKAFFFDVSFA